MQKDIDKFNINLYIKSMLCQFIYNDTTFLERQDILKAR